MLILSIKSDSKTTVCVCNLFPDSVCTVIQVLQHGAVLCNIPSAAVNCNPHLLCKAAMVA